MLKAMILSGANSWPRPQTHPLSPAASQPLLKELWLGLGQLPRNAGATGIEMANSFRPMPGDCPVKQSETLRLLRFKKERGKKKKKKDGLILKVLERNQGQKWLGCILTACGSMMQHLDLAYHMEQGTKSMHANRWILQDKTTSIYTRLKYFNACVSAVVCFGGGHRTLYKKQLYTLDVLFPKLCRSIVTPPSDTDWSLEWHEILHRWNDRARTFAQTAGLPPWSFCVCVCRQHWKLASHIANLPEHRLVRRVLAWNPFVRYRSLGRRPHTWDYQLQAFCRYKGLGPWLEEAKYHHHWNALFEDFYTFCQM